MLSVFAILPFIMAVILRIQGGYAIQEIFENERVSQTLLGGFTISVLLWLMYGLLHILVWSFKKCFSNQ